MPAFPPELPFNPASTACIYRDRTQVLATTWESIRFDRAFTGGVQE
jgi:hypothetical protein